MAGRFLNEDPAEWDPGDTNLYRYVGNEIGDPRMNYCELPYQAEWLGTSIQPVIRLVRGLHP
jgi:hypothetical protein